MRRFTQYVGTPGNQFQAHLLIDKPCLISFAHARKKTWLTKNGYADAFSHLLVDSGAYSEMTLGVAIDGYEYVDYVQSLSRVTAWAGIDDISGDWRRSIDNYQKFGGFPTIHDTDPIELLDDLIPMAREGQGWIGVGLEPPRQGKQEKVREILDRMPSDLHVHGWALGRYRRMSDRWDSMDSVHAWFEFGKIRNALGPWLTPTEAMELAVKKVERESGAYEAERGAGEDHQ